MTVTATVFISHASEDGDTVAVPLAERLKELGLNVWLDQWDLTLGDGLRHAIEKALSESSFGVVIISPDYMRKAWTTRELDGLFSLETVSRTKILPVLHNVGNSELAAKWPMLANRITCSTSGGLGVVAEQIVTACQRANAPGGPNEPPEAILSSYQRRVFEAVDHHDLVQLKYELEDFLRKFPAHPQSRMLLDRVSRALNYEDAPAARAPAATRLGVPPRGRFPSAGLAAGAGAFVVFLALIATTVLRPTRPLDSNPTTVAKSAVRRTPITNLGTTARTDDEMIVEGKIDDSRDVSVYVLSRVTGATSWSVDRALLRGDGSWALYASVQDERRYRWGSPGTYELLALVSERQSLEPMLGKQIEGLARLSSELPDAKLRQVGVELSDPYQVKVLPQVNGIAVNTISAAANLS